MRFDREYFAGFNRLADRCVSLKTGNQLTWILDEKIIFRNRSWIQEERQKWRSQMGKKPKEKMENVSM